MDLSDPTRAVTATLDGPILAVLAAAGRPLTVGEVAAQSARGSEIGIRRTIARLVDQGLVRATIVGRNRVHELNREHIAAGIADLMTGLRLELWRRLRAELATWDPAPVYAAVFGSAARGDGDEYSDIDLLLVHPPFPDERPPQGGLGTVLMSGFAARPAADPERWHAQVDGLRGHVQRWTGNPLQVVDLSYYEWWQPSRSHGRLLDEVRRDGIVVAHDREIVPAVGEVRGG
jgi:DNA-binding transcriptional ArsR family regulator